MIIVSKEQSELFYSALPEEIIDIFKSKIRLLYIDDQTLFWKSSVSDEDKPLLSKHSTAIKSQLRIVLNCGGISNLKDSDEKIDFFIKAVQLLEPKRVEFSLS